MYFEEGMNLLRGMNEVKGEMRYKDNEEDFSLVFNFDDGTVQSCIKNLKDGVNDTVSFIGHLPVNYLMSNNWTVEFTK